MHSENPFNGRLPACLGSDPDSTTERLYRGQLCTPKAPPVQQDIWRPCTACEGPVAAERLGKQQGLRPRPRPSERGRPSVSAEGSVSGGAPRPRRRGDKWIWVAQSRGVCEENGRRSALPPARASGSAGGKLAAPQNGRTSALRPQSPEFESSPALLYCVPWIRAHAMSDNQFS